MYVWSKRRGRKYLLYSALLYSALLYSALLYSALLYPAPHHLSRKKKQTIVMVIGIGQRILVIFAYHMYRYILFIFSFQ